MLGQKHNKPFITLLPIPMRKYTKDCGKHTHVLTKICKETDRIIRRCYTCKEYYPLDKEHFQANSHEQMGFMFQCKNCRNSYKLERKKILKEQNVEQPKVETKEQKQHSLFEANDTLETKLNKVLAYLGIK